MAKTLASDPGGPDFQPAQAFAAEALFVDGAKKALG
jgi:hypothetical protein